MASRLVEEDGEHRELKLQFVDPENEHRGIMDATSRTRAGATERLLDSAFRQPDELTFFKMMALGTWRSTTPTSTGAVQD